MKDQAQFSLTDFVDAAKVRRQPFDYGDMEGEAECIGWQIILFRTHAEPHRIAALSMDELDTPALNGICSQLLERLHLPIEQGMSLEAIERVLGKYTFSSDLWESPTLYYFVQPERMICCGVDNTRGLCQVEVMYDQEIRRQRIATLL